MGYMNSGSQMMGNNGMHQGQIRGLHQHSVSQGAQRPISYIPPQNMQVKGLYPQQTFPQRPPGGGGGGNPRGGGLPDMRGGLGNSSATPN